MLTQTERSAQKKEILSFLFAGFYFDNPEIIPPLVQGDFRFSKSGERVARFASKEAEVRALIEGQFMAKRIHADQMGLEIGEWGGAFPLIEKKKTSPQP